MTVYYDMPAEEYHALPAFSAGLGWDIVSPDGCLALAYHNSRWLNPDGYIPVRDEIMENGTMIHLAALEYHLLEQRISIIDAKDYRTQKARNLRDDAYASGLIPILAERDPGATGPSFQKLMAIRKSLESNDMAANLLYTEGGRSEVSFTWNIDDIPCKARADRVVNGLLIDLKSAPSASPQYFQRSMTIYGHHMRAAYYLDGWSQQEYEARGDALWDYVFVVVQKEPPYLCNVYRLGERAIEWGRALTSRALDLFYKAYLTDKWPGFDAAILDLPLWAEHQLADRKEAGDL